MFAQMMKFQMESQLKNEEKPLQIQKENEERILKNDEKQQLQKENKERILKNEEKTTVLPWIAKTRSTFLKSQ